MSFRSKLSVGIRPHLAVVLVTVGVLALAGCGSDGAQPDTTVTTTGSETSPPVSTRGVVDKEQRPAGCQTDDTDQAHPEAAPAGITWKAHGDWKLTPEPNGSLTGAFAKLSGPNGFILWKK